MIPYSPPLADMRFALEELAGIAEIATLPGYDHADADTVDAVLNEAAKLARDVLAPLNSVGDQMGSILENGAVRTPDGFKDAYRTYVDGGWNALPFAEEWGGQGLPASIGLVVSEMWNAANMGFALCPMLTVGAIEALERHGTDALKEKFLPKLVSGAWTGTMNLTEPAAGSDVGALRTKAVRDGDQWRISGQKIFITYGDHDFTDNIIHLVLARTPDAPAGTKGISLFLVPKYLVKDDGTLGERNDVRTVSLEHKLGIHASPTAILAFGDHDGAIGYMIGEENRGMECMFTMMNSARINVGVQGIAIGERAYQQARDYAKTRIQGKPAGVKGDQPLPIIHHGDVRRMLLAMRSRIEAARGLAYYAAGLIDRAHRLPDAQARAWAQARVDLLIPVVKGWSTDLGIENSSLAVQVHGGMGFIEETGVAQHYRDARIAAIYEGTNGIQALDLIGRKIGRDQGAEAARFIATMRTLDGVLADLPGDDLALIRRTLNAAIDTLETGVKTLLGILATDAPAAQAIAVPFMTLFSLTAGGWVMAKAAAAAQTKLANRTGDARFLETKLITARFYAEQYLTQVPSLLGSLESGRTILGIDPDML